jgi:hypothetical protein
MTLQNCLPKSWILHWRTDFLYSYYMTCRGLCLELSSELQLETRGLMQVCLFINHWVRRIYCVEAMHKRVQGNL